MKQEIRTNPLPGIGAAARWALYFGATVVLVATGMDAAAPNGYRTWTHVKSALITRTHPASAAEGGLHHIYANPKAAEGYRTGQFPDGSVIVYELLETSDKDGVISEGGRRRLDVMIKDSGRYQATGGWGYERYIGTSSTDNVLDGRSAAQCDECHSRAREHGFVFSRMR